MKKLLLPLALTTALVDLHGSNLDLTPRYVETMIDGYRARQLYLLEDSRKIGLSPDTETTVAAEAGGLLFKFTKLPDASFRVGPSPFTPAEALDTPETLERYRAAALALAPAGATEVKVAEEIANPLPINQWQSHRFIVSYQVGASTAKLSVTFLNVNPSSQLLLVTRASSREFANAAERSFHLIRTWHEVLPGDIAATTGG
jgi:hypothetical protein